MDTSNTTNRKNFIKRNLDLICINVAAIILFIFVLPGSAFSKKDIMISVCPFFFLINIRLIFKCFKILRSLDSIEKHDFDRSDNRKLMIAASILASIMVLSVFLIVVKGMVWAGVVVLLVSGSIFIYYDYTIKKAVHIKKLEREKLGQEQ